MTETTCKGCGKPMVWGMTVEGKAIPLDPRAPIYFVYPDGKCERSENSFMVSHFATCAKANKF